MCTSLSFKATMNQACPSSTQWKVIISNSISFFVLDRTDVEDIVSAPNNGSYRWDAYYTKPVVVDDNHYNLASGCNYFITLESWTNQIYSPYSAIINPTDGGLPTNASCPQDHGKFLPSDGTCLCLCFKLYVQKLTLSRE
jgi:hypothetical protein